MSEDQLETIELSDWECRAEDLRTQIRGVRALFQQQENMIHGLERRIWDQENKISRLAAALEEVQNMVADTLRPRRQDNET